MVLVPVIPLAGIAAVLFAWYLARDVLSRDKGTPKMQEVGEMIFEGAMAFLKRMNSTIAYLSVVTAIVITFLVGLLDNNMTLGVLTGIAFLVGAAASAISGYIGMYISVRSNLRTAAAAQRSLVDAITVALRGGAVSGFLVVALSLIGVSGIFYIFNLLLPILDPSIATSASQLGITVEQMAFEKTPFSIVGFGFGASFVALFAQLGGGIYTKAADVGADLVGKVEAGIPEDDPRNAAVIADLVGDNVGDCAGRGADLFESMSAENIGAMILGVAIYQLTKDPAWIMFPLVLRSFGIFATIVGLMSVGYFASEDGDPMSALNGGYYVATGLSVAALALVTNVMMGSAWLPFFLCGIVGILTGLSFVFITQYYTAGAWRPVQEIARASRTGPATNIIIGVAVGFETTAVTAITISVAIIAAYFLGTSAVLADGNPVPNGGIFGTAVATMGMLMSAAYILAMDTFGPITDNAGGITEFSGAPESARRITDSLDAVGNTTKALTKGYAVASAALAAFLLFSAYLDKVKEIFAHDGRINPVTQRVYALTDHLAVDLSQVHTFVGALLGVMLVFLFSSLAIRAVGKTAGDIIDEVRRQFRTDPGIMLGTSRPDYARAVDITAKAALREMVAPGILAVGLPVVVGLAFRFGMPNNPNAGWESVAGLLMVGTIAGVILATFLNNSGGAWDNAKKFIESGGLRDERGRIEGKGSEAHKAAVVGDTVGDPFKDTAGPALHVLVKLLSTITLVLAPLFVAR